MEALLEPKLEFDPKSLTLVAKKALFLKLLKMGLKLSVVSKQVNISEVTAYRWKNLNALKESTERDKADAGITANGVLQSDALSASNPTPPDAVATILSGSLEKAATLYARAASGEGEAVDSTARQAAEKLLKSRGYLVDEGREIVSIYEGMSSDELASRLSASSKAVLGRAVAVTTSGPKAAQALTPQPETMQAVSCVSATGALDLALGTASSFGDEAGPNLSELPDAVAP